MQGREVKEEEEKEKTLLLKPIGCSSFEHEAFGRGQSLRGERRRDAENFRRGFVLVLFFFSFSLLMHSGGILL
jgi:hypothetical protein